MYKGIPSLIALALLLAASFSCSENKPAQPEYCWMGVSALYSTGIAVADTSQVHAAFDAYVEYIHASPDSFPDGATELLYQDSAFARVFEGLSYWSVCFLESNPRFTEPQRECYLYIDETGRAMRAFGCI